MLRWLFRISVVTTLMTLGVAACVGGPEDSQQLNPQPLPPKSPDNDESDNAGTGSGGEPTASTAMPDAGASDGDATPDGDR